MFGNAMRPVSSLGLCLVFYSGLSLAPLWGHAQEDVPGSEPLAFEVGPGSFPIGGDLAEIDLPEDFLFLGAEASQEFMERTENPVGGNEVATLLPASEEAGWFVILEWDEIGYVDDEEADLDADALLDSIRDGTEAANEIRRERGWSTMQIVGWREAPFYDPATQNLTWSIIGESEGDQNVNRMIKLLGRRGVMTATLVAGPEELDAAAARTDELLAAYRFRPGSRYAEFVPGQDRLAEIGLAALVAGGAGAALAKTGLLARFWKLIVGGLVAAGAGLSRLFRRTRPEV